MKFAPTALLALFALLLSSTAMAQWTWTPETKRFVNIRRMPKETPELQVEHARSLMLQGEYDQALQETKKFREFYPDAEESDVNQFLRGEIKLSQKDYVDAADEYQQVVLSYPQSELFDSVIEKQYTVGDSLFEEGEDRLADAGKRKWRRLGIKWRPFKNRPFKKAIGVYSMVIENQPFTDAAAQAQYKIGLCHFTREEYVEAAFEYRRVIEDYADSPWVVDGTYGLAECYHRSSYPSKYDQSPSMLTIDAVDLFTARYGTDPRADDLAVVRRQMVENIAQQRLETAQFHARRREYESARIYYEVVVEQFEGTKAAEEAQSWLDSDETT